ncbi:MAG: hypothetical protein FI707_15060 [SAR202 cluster bacterium]|nr:hypothetical protein [Chloroflexota bacterium]MDP6419957.1 Coenzyme F420 hydrogenase/dehydrogenase, beta subunit C-terminal domain [SAR202 cluster bacterium]HAL46137.1 hypothetical protein [Dehalococcoidia bacterium]MDP6665757.1 Coenzyme F420 hydrogenase/dehydrogenase, beta subunit C-terminal domain [SAR202 cluster bacterium]MDP6798316.1 Coenzyme F420 hydrogenase/dehydrogenase, beta subunit C-terminal domain [SAR202 cluster bacterium]
MTTQTAQGQLREHVLDAGLCTVCGACSGLCPYLKPFQGRVAVVDRCTLPEDEGRCIAHCPRVGTDMEQLHQDLFGSTYSAEPVGAVRKVLMTRSANPAVREAAQYGGTVTTLVQNALSGGMVKRAILTRTVDGRPMGVSVSTPEEVLDSAGSNYLAAPTLAALNQTNGSGASPVAFVGTPCQVIGFRKVAGLAASSNGSGQQPVVIGLFCTWALGHSFLELLKEKAPTGEIVKTDVPPPPAQQFDIETTDEKVSLPLDDVRAHILDACATCHDMTAELSDISVGSAEGISGWNTVLVRTERGEKLLQQAVDSGILEVQDLPEASLEHLKMASTNKRTRAFQRLSEQSGNPEELGHLRMTSQAAHRVLDGS